MEPEDCEGGPTLQQLRKAALCSLTNYIVAVLEDALLQPVCGTVKESVTEETRTDTYHTMMGGRRSRRRKNERTMTMMMTMMYGMKLSEGWLAAAWMASQVKT